MQEEPSRSGHARGCEHHEDRRDTALDGDDGPTSVRHREPDVDRSDQDELQSVDRRRSEPPEREWRRGLDPADDDAPKDGSTGGLLSLAWIHRFDGPKRLREGVVGSSARRNASISGEGASSIAPKRSVEPHPTEKARSMEAFAARRGQIGWAMTLRPTAAAP